MIMEWDDLGADHIISDMCQSHDCRDQLLKLKEVNPAFKCTLFAIPGEMTQELLDWCKMNEHWIELAVHGFTHSSNYECEKMTYFEFEENMEKFFDMINDYFVKVFRAPGWQISNEAFDWLKDNDWVVADQSYNDNRRPLNMNSYNNHDGQFAIHKFIGMENNVIKWEQTPVEAYHGHTWDVGWNGIYEDFEKVADLVRNAEEFKFVSELFV